MKTPVKSLTVVSLLACSFYATADQPGTEAEREAAEDLRESADVLRQLQAHDPALAARLSEAKGAFVLPDYATASLIVGGSGGEGVVMTQRDGEWGNPAFYDVGNIDIGAQAGAAAGSIVMLLMTDEAVDAFDTDTDFALTAEAGLTIVNWSASASGSSMDGDVLVWSDTEGLLAEASVGVGGIVWDDDDNREYYQRDVSAADVLSGDVQDPNAEILRSEFAEFSTRSSDASIQDQPLESTK